MYESKILNSNLYGVQWSESEHQENRRSEFIIEEVSND